MRIALFLAATAMTHASGFTQTAPAAGHEAAAGRQAESCTGRKFETKVEVTVDGKKRSSPVKLCGKEGQTDADWASTLKDAANKVAANEKMPKAARDQIIAALNAEIAKVQITRVEPEMPLTSALPATVRPPAERPPQYSSLPPIPTAPAAAKSSSAKPRALLPRPRLSLQCMTPAEQGGGSCDSLRRNSVFTVRADENLAGGARLRLLREGNFRDEIILAPMRQGQSFRFKLPPKVCAGAYRTSLAIEILGGSANGSGATSTGDTLGPYELRC